MQDASTRINYKIIGPIQHTHTYRDIERVMKITGVSREDPPINTFHIPIRDLVLVHARTSHKRANGDAPTSKGCYSQLFSHRLDVL